MENWVWKADIGKLRFEKFGNLKFGKLLELGAAEARGIMLTGAGGSGLGAAVVLPLLPFKILCENPVG